MYWKASFHIWEGFFSPATRFLDHIVELVQISGTGRSQSLAKNLSEFQSLSRAVYASSAGSASLGSQCRHAEWRRWQVPLTLSLPAQHINALLWFSQLCSFCPQSTDQHCVQPWNTWTRKRELQFF